MTRIKQQTQSGCFYSTPPARLAAMATLHDNNRHASFTLAKKTPRIQTPHDKKATKRGKKVKEKK